jgi:uncharacterized RDD family membrane protein YckC
MKKEGNKDYPIEDSQFSAFIPGPQEQIAFEKAGFWRRFAAYSLDWLIIGWIQGVILGLGLIESLPFIVQSVTSFTIPFIYFVWPYARGGATPGKRLFGIRVVSLDGSPLNWRKVICRTRGYIPSTIFLYLGFLWALWDSNKQAWHDKVASTIVVPNSVTLEQLQATYDAGVSYPKQNRLVLGLAIVTLLFLVIAVIWFGSFMLSGLSEIQALGSWPELLGANGQTSFAPSPSDTVAELPTISASPDQAVIIDLTHLGLEKADVQNAREDVSWEGGLLDEGIVVTYSLDGKDLLYIWGLKYTDDILAQHDFEALESWAKDTCSFYTYRTLLSGGILTCDGSSAYDKIIHRENWIIDILAEGDTELDLALLVNDVQDAIADHWAATPAVSSSNQYIESRQDNTPDEQVDTSGIENPILYIERGNAYLNYGEHLLAIDNYTKAIELNSNDAVAFNNRGYAYTLNGDLDLAIEDYDQAIALDPDYGMAYNNLGFTLNQLGDTSSAISAYRTSIRVSDDPTIYQYAEDQLKELGVEP